MDKLVSYYTRNSDGASYHDITEIVMAFYFCRLHLYEVNDDHVDAERRAVYIWTSMLELLAIFVICDTTRRNVISEAVALMFLVLRNDVCHPERKLNIQTKEERNKLNHHFCKQGGIKKGKLKVSASLIYYAAETNNYKDILPSKSKTENKHIFIRKYIIEIIYCRGCIQNETGIYLDPKSQILNYRFMFIYHCKFNNEHPIFQNIITKVW